MTWWSFFGFVQPSTNTNNASTSTLYDSYARQTQTTGAHGAVTTYSYTTSPPTVTATINGRWTTTTLDGAGQDDQGNLGRWDGHTEHCGSGVRFVRVFADGEDGETVAALRAGRDGGLDGLQLTWNRTHGQCAVAGWRFGFDVFVFGEHGDFDRSFRGVEDFHDGRGGECDARDGAESGGRVDLVTTYTYDIYNHLAQVQMTRGTRPPRRGRGLTRTPPPG